MRYRSISIGHEDVVREFCNQLCATAQTNIGTVTDPNNALKKHLMDIFGEADEIRARLHLETRVSDYYKRLDKLLAKESSDKSLPKKMRVVSGRPGSNVKNLFDTEDPTIPSRLTLLEIAFTLKLTASECNELLKITGQYPLHWGGDPQESILYFCLDKGLTHLDAIRMYENYCANKPLPELSERTNETLSQRSKCIAGALAEALSCEDLDTSKVLFEEKLRYYSASYSYFCGRVRKYMIVFFERNSTRKGKDGKIDKKVSLQPDLDMLFGYSLYKKEVSMRKQQDKKRKEALGNHSHATGQDEHEYEFEDNETTRESLQRYIRGTHSDLSKIKSGESFPTREAVMMLLCVDYYKNYKSFSAHSSLEEYVNTWLNHFDLEELNDSRILEALLLELSNYQLNERDSRLPKNKTDQYILFPECGGNYIRQASHILNKYVMHLEKEHGITLPTGIFKLIKKDNYIQDLFLKTPGDKRQ